MWTLARIFGNKYIRHSFIADLDLCLCVRVCVCAIFLSLPQIIIIKIWMCANRFMHSRWIRQIFGERISIVQIKQSRCRIGKGRRNHVGRLCESDKWSWNSYVRISIFKEGQIDYFIVFFFDFSKSGFRYSLIKYKTTDLWRLRLFVNQIYSNFNVIVRVRIEFGRKPKEKKTPAEAIQRHVRRDGFPTANMLNKSKTIKCDRRPEWMKWYT